MTVFDITNEFCYNLQNLEESEFEKYLFTRLDMDCAINLSDAENKLNNEQITRTIHAAYAVGIELKHVPKKRLREVSQIFT